MPRPHSFDHRCYELAEHFLSDESGCDEADKNSLAQAIQDAAEDWLRDWKES